ncbi:MAG TPA: rhodanese-like domain-containing protein [bacterium]|nr:rhodanese-like domain-containing protein [bacterium]
MRRAAIVLLGLALVMTVTVPAISQGWVGKDGQAVRGGPSYGDLKSRTSPADEPLLDSVMYASETLLAQMPEDSYMIRPAVARRLMRERAVLVLDVRERAAFEVGRVPRAVNIPLRELSQALNRLPADKSTTIVVYCGNGDRGGMALAFLRLWGYRNVFSIIDGVSGWTAAGLPLEAPDPGWLDPRIIARPR